MIRHQFMGRYQFLFYATTQDLTPVLALLEAWLSIDNPNICRACLRDLEPKMLPPGATLHVILPDGTDLSFKGKAR